MNVSRNVVLVDEQDNTIGLMPQDVAHHLDTPLHRGFSLYVFHKQGDLLLQQRAERKVTWGGFWSNSCCGHPREGESYLAAAARRFKEEVGIEVESIEKMVDYRYRFEYNGVAENEICPIIVGIVRNKEVRVNPVEIQNTRWTSWSDYLKEMKENGDTFSPWSKEQVKILSKNSRFRDWLSRHRIELR